MQWHVDTVESGKYSGWIVDPEHTERVFEILILAGDNVLARGRADQPAHAGHGFCLEFAPPQESSPEGKLLVVCLGAHPDLPALILHSPVREEIGKALASYQQGSSQSSLKLEALCLPSLQGKSVLDLGCNEGYFSLHAHLAGARRVLGIDQSELAVAKARARAALITLNSGMEEKGSLEFRQGSWWDVPEERFDVILLLSAIHYEREQKKLLDMLLTHLEPEGVLVLECGVLRGTQNGWLRVRRDIDVRRFPSEAYLLDTLLAAYAVRPVSRSPDQAGDPVPRTVYHCVPRRPVVAVIRGKSGTGKSVLARLLGRKGVPVFRADVFLREYGGRFRHLAPDTALYRMMRDELDNFTLNLATARIKELGATRELCRDFIRCLPLDEDLCVVEGALFEDEELFAELTRMLEKHGAVVWDTQRVKTIPSP